MNSKFIFGCIGMGGLLTINIALAKKCIKLTKRNKVLVDEYFNVFDINMQQFKSIVSLIKDHDAMNKRVQEYEEILKVNGINVDDFKSQEET